MAKAGSGLQAGAWKVTGAALGINLALGILYAWSIFKEPIRLSIESGQPGGFGWSLSSINDPYALSCLVFAFAMVPAGRIQDRLGPKLTAILGGLMVGSGLLLVTFTTSYAMWLLGFGVLVGVGIGFGYACTTPVVLKWFPPSMTGLAAGIVVSGAGLAPVYMAPLAHYLLKAYGLNGALRGFGLGILVVVCLLALLLSNPPQSESGSAKGNKSTPATVETGPFEILKSGVFWQVWLLFFAAAGAGLMVIGSVAGMAKASMGELAFVAVATVAVGNAVGRIAAGVVSDRIGRENTMLAVLIVQAGLMFLAIPVVGSEHGGAAVLVLLATFIGFNYGTNLSLFPAMAKDMWGLKNFGANYGLLYTAWGVGGLVMARVSQTLKTASGNYSSSFLAAAGLLIVAAVITYRLKKKDRTSIPRLVEAKIKQ